MPEPLLGNDERKKLERILQEKTLSERERQELLQILGMNECIDPQKQLAEIKNLADLYFLGIGGVQMSCLDAIRWYEIVINRSNVDSDPKSFKKSRALEKLESMFLILSKEERIKLEQLLQDPLIDDHERDTLSFAIAFITNPDTQHSDTHLSSMKNLAGIYRDGLGSMQPSYRDAIRWYEQLIKYSNSKNDRAGEYKSEGYNELGKIFWFGRGVKREPNKAMEYWELAIQSGTSETRITRQSMDAIANLAQVYFTGNGVPQDKNKGLSLYLHPAKLGRATAINFLLQQEKEGIIQFLEWKINSKGEKFPTEWDISKIKIIDPYQDLARRVAALEESTAQEKRQTNKAQERLESRVTSVETELVRLRADFEKKYDDNRIAAIESLLKDDLFFDGLMKDLEKSQKHIDYYYEVLRILTSLRIADLAIGSGHVAGSSSKSASTAKGIMIGVSAGLQVVTTGLSSALGGFVAAAKAVIDHIDANVQEMKSVARSSTAPDLITASKRASLMAMFVTLALAEDVAKQDNTKATGIKKTAQKAFSILIHYDAADTPLKVHAKNTVAELVEAQHKVRAGTPNEVGTYVNSVCQTALNKSELELAAMITKGRRFVTSQTATSDAVAKEANAPAKVRVLPIPASSRPTPSAPPYLGSATTGKPTVSLVKTPLTPPASPPTSGIVAGGTSPPHKKVSKFGS